MASPEDPEADRATKTRLPSDLLILCSRQWSMPVCIHRSTNGARRWPLGLRDLGLVVREDEVAAAAVDLESACRDTSCHRGTLDVPARDAPGPTATSQEGSSGSERCQSTKSSGSRFPAMSGTLPRSLAIASISLRGRARPPEGRIGRDAEVDLAVGGVGEPGVQQPLDQRRSSAARAGSRAAGGRAAAVEAGHLGQEGRHPAVAEGEVVLAGLARLAQHVVVDIGQVLHVDDVVAEVLRGTDAGRRS